MNYGNSSEYENAAIELLSCGKPQQALDLFDEGLRKYPSDPDLLLGRGMALNDLKRPAEARAAFLAVIKIAPQLTDALQGLAEAELTLGNLSAGVEVARSACDNPEETSAEFVHSIALLLYRHRQFLDAEHCYRRAIGIDRTHGHSWIGLASCLHHQGKRDEAILILKEAVIDRLPGFWEAYSYLGCMLYDAGRAAEADALLKKIPLDELRDPEAAARLRAALNAGKFPERARVLREIERRARVEKSKEKVAALPHSETGTFVIGPVRGDYDRLMEFLNHLHVVDEAGKWCGEDVRLVFIGPFIGKGRGKLKTLRYLEKLQKQATRKSGKETIVLVASPGEPLKGNGFAHCVNDEWIITVPGLSSAAISKALSVVRGQYAGSGPMRPPVIRAVCRELENSAGYLDGKPERKLDRSSLFHGQICAAEGEPLARAEREGKNLIRLDSGFNYGIRLVCLRFHEGAWKAIELPMAQKRFQALESHFSESFGLELPAALKNDPQTEPLHPESDEWLAYSWSAKSEKVPLPVFPDNFEKTPKGTWMLGFWGYGANSYAFYFVRKDNKREIFLRLGYGGAYGDAKQDGLEVKETLQRYMAFEEWAAVNLERWSISSNMGSWQGWIERKGSGTREDLSVGYVKDLRFPNEPEILDRGSSESAPSSGVVKEPARSGKGMKDTREELVSSKQDIIAIGDLHGSLEALIEIVRYAGLLETQWESGWAGGNTIVVQTGDVIDRGPSSLEVYESLGRLQEKAAAKGGEVIRLIGNHELYILQGMYRATNLKDPEAFRVRLEDDLFSGKVQGVCAAQGFLFTHAGVRSKIMETLLEGWKAGESGDLSAFIARAINIVLMKAVESGDWSHPIFHVGVSRGGSHSVGGVFWADCSEMFGSAGAGRIKQVFGHTPGKKIAINSSERLADIDAGMVFGGPAQYLRIRNGKMLPMKVVKGEFERPDAH